MASPGETPSNSSGSPSAAIRRWGGAPLEELIDHVLVSYHKPLKDELPRLMEMAITVLHRHRDQDPEVLTELHDLLFSLKHELEDHMLVEEQLLFHMIRQGNGATADEPIARMELDHEATRNALRRFGELTGGYEVPEYACDTCRALWLGLAALETEMHAHIRLENDILFPRARQS